MYFEYFSIENIFLKLNYTSTSSEGVIDDLPPSKLIVVTGRGCFKSLFPSILHFGVWFSSRYFFLRNC